MNRLVDYALSFVGLPYRWGGDDPILGFDCSGFVQEILASVGEDPKGDQNAHSLFLHFKRYGTIQKGNISGEGDLAFFGTQSRVTHIAFCIDKYRMVEAGGGGSLIRTREDAEIKNAYVRVRPIDTRFDLVSIIRPEYQFLNW